MNVKEKKYYMAFVNCQGSGISHGIVEACSLDAAAAHPISVMYGSPSGPNGTYLPSDYERIEELPESMQNWTNEKLMEYFNSDLFDVHKTPVMTLNAYVAHDPNSCDLGGIDYRTSTIYHQIPNEKTGKWKKYTESMSVERDEEGNIRIISNKWDWKWYTAWTLAIISGLVFMFMFPG